MFYELVTALSRKQKQAVFSLIDAVALPVALTLAVALEASVKADLTTLRGLLPLMGAMVAIGTGLGWWLGLPRTTLNAYETRGIGPTAMLAILMSGIGYALNSMMQAGLPFGVFAIFGLVFLVASASWRMALRQATIQVYRRGKRRMRVLIYGAGQTGQQLVAALRHDDEVQAIGFVDDNPTLQSGVVAGLRVHGSTGIKELVMRKEIDRVVLAMPSLNQSAQARIAHRLRAVGCEVHALPSFAELISEGELGKRVSPVSLDDLLGRNRLEKELPGVTDAYSGRRILISGAGGSIGAELCRQVIACKPDCLVLLDHSELALYNIDKELRDLNPDLHIVPILGSVLNDALVRDLLQDHAIDVVLHAAAYKHVPMVEFNPLAGLNNNVIGTKVLADAARDCGVERFILVSSDKAVRPTNVMGASKRLAELIVQDLATRSSGTRFSMVRFGNVLGSSGSVIPLFEEQIARGGPVTLTHSGVTRYFMTISEAARLVLLAGSFARGGDVFVLDMGDPVPIRKLARQMIEGAGYSVRSPSNPDGDIEIQITGLRPGEKLHEELLISPDMLTTPHAKILRAQEGYLSEIEMATALKDLRLSLEQRDEDGARAVIERWVEHGLRPEAAQQS
ncbi:MAG: polysaccharide biosynthesis protein [Pelagimonas sp.]|jgi:FlaA1/EpsC-like NDP-sugar epimerase|nr:polysaccharide biosynthesis protein [Pelagimonas sp.]